MAKKKKKEWYMYHKRVPDNRDCRTLVEGKTSCPEISKNTQWARLYFRWALNIEPTSDILIQMGKILWTDTGVSSHMEEKH